MGRILLPIIILMVLLSGSCAKESYADAVSGATARKGPTARVLLNQIMPQAMSDGIVKIAVLVNQKTGDNARQFTQGCVSEGRSMGFTVDTYVSDADENRCREYAEGIALADYDGLIFAYGNVGFSYDILKPVADAGVKIVTFEARPYRDNESIKGIFTTFQDDYRLARLSLETIMTLADGNTERPPHVIRVGCDPGILFLDRRTWEFNAFVNNGKITEVAFIRLDNLENPYISAWEALAQYLPLFPPGSVDALWVPWDEFAVGCAAALEAAGRHDIKMVSIGLSNEDIQMMQRHSEFWIANTVVDPNLAGTINMRILAALLAGETIPGDNFLFNPLLLQSENLNPTVNIANISVIVPHWNDNTGIFDHYQWMIDLKEAESKYLRISPVPSASQDTAQ